MKSNLQSPTRFESLENRSLMSSVAVTSLADSGPGTLREAIADASSGDTINFGSLTGTITLNAQLDFSNKDLTVQGPGRAALTLDAHNIGRAIFSSGMNSVTLKDLKVIGGGTTTEAGAGIAIDNGGNEGFAYLKLDNCDITGGAALQSGGGVHADATQVTIDNCNFWDNAAYSNTADAYGGAVLATDWCGLSINRSTFYNNSATTGNENANAAGGAVYGSDHCTVGVTNSTFYGNTAEGATQSNNSGSGFSKGGAVYLEGYGDFVHCTVSGNSVVPAGNSLGENSGGGLFIQSYSTTNIQYCVIAGNTAPLYADIQTQNYVPIIYTLVGDGDGSNTSNGTDSNIVGTTSNPVEAKLATLANNGGDTKMLALQSDSPAVNAGSGSLTTIDQRGYVRDANPDLGAYEFNATPPAPAAPTFPTAPSGALGSNGKTATLSGTASVSSGAVTYAWRLAAKPAHAPNAVFSNSNSANTMAAFGKVGTYRIRVVATDSNGVSSMRTFTMVVAAQPTRLRILQHNQTLSADRPTTMRAIIIDQFGAKMSNQPVFSWSLLHGEGSIDAITGVYTPSNARYSHLLFQASANSLTGVAGNRLKAA